MKGVFISQVYDTQVVQKCGCKTGRDHEAHKSTFRTFITFAYPCSFVFACFVFR